MNILITGANGLIGRKLLNKLILDETVVGTDISECEFEKYPVKWEVANLINSKTISFLYTVH